MSEFKNYSVTVLIEGGSDLDRRLEAIARAEGVRKEEAVRRSVISGIYHHMCRNLELMERGIRKSEGGKKGQT